LIIAELKVEREKVSKSCDFDAFGTRPINSRQLTHYNLNFKTKMKMSRKKAAHVSCYIDVKSCENHDKNFQATIGV
jgi:hypothetical protein